jgi:hypothetical protein
VLFAIVQDDQMNLVKNIELVVQHHKYPKKVDIVNPVMNNNLDHCLNMHQSRKQQVVRVQESLAKDY